jgi:COP9 signalosome complex subunit 4
LKISELFLKEADCGQAEIFLSRAAPLEKDTTAVDLQVQYKAAQAKIWDLKRKFIEAASKYYELSHEQLLSEVNRTLALNNALNCTILASAGMQI